MSFSDLPTLNALLNCTAAALLFFGRRQILRGDALSHRRLMLGALTVSLLFLASYLTYHAKVGSVAYPLKDWTRTVYLLVLAPHSILAGLQVPFIIVAVIAALRGQYKLHKRLMRWVWPVWMFVSLSGVTVYLMLYQFALRTVGR